MRTNCKSVLVRIYDTQGLLAPPMLKFKNDLRNLIKIQPSWTELIPLGHRAVWVNNFKTIEDLRDLMYIRFTIPSDAVRPSYIHGLATGTHVRGIIENVLGDWIKESARFCDIKIALS